jgi:TolB-like protein
MAGRSDRLTGYKLALEVFGRPETFDPIVDPVVRVEAGRLRDKLREYYASDGQGDLVHIQLPKGTYAPQIEVRRAGQTTSPTRKLSLSIPALAVLPFDDMSAIKNFGYLGDGMAEDIITTLSRFPDLLVVARASSFAYRGKAFDMRKVGEELGVDYVLEGSVRKDGNKLRIVSQLIETTSGAHVWAERFDRLGKNPWVLQ